ncbi:MAG TPA: FHA domain-containing protein, partial [Pirellulaceae bacterium]
MPSLFVIQGPDQGRRFDLRDDPLVVGRGKESGIRLQDTEISRRHAELVPLPDEQAFELHDLGSANGSYVNSQRVQRHTLRTGDRVQLGRTLMMYTGA